MPQEIKNCYYYLDLPFNADQDSILARQKSMIKVFRAKGLKKHKSYAKDIDKVMECTSQILTYVEKNGIPEPECQFEVKARDVWGILFATILLGVVCIVSFITLLQ